MTAPVNIHQTRKKNPIRKSCSKRQKPQKLHLKEHDACERLHVKKKNNRDSLTGRFIKGNRIWKNRRASGRRPLFSSAEQLHCACYQYFEWVTSNPYKETIYRVSRGKVITAMVPKMRPMTLTGMCLFIGMSLVTWLQYKKRSPDFTYICTMAEMVIREQKFCGAVVGFFNPAIIARDIGLTDRRDVTSNGKAIVPDHTTHTINLSNLDDSEIKALLDITTKIMK